MPVFIFMLLALATLSGCTSCFKGPCEDDLARYCGLEKPGGASQARCLEKFKPKFSPDCRESLTKKEPTK